MSVLFISLKALSLYTIYAAPFLPAISETRGPQSPINLIYHQSNVFRIGGAFHPEKKSLSSTCDKIYALIVINKLF